MAPLKAEWVSMCGAMPTPRGYSFTVSWFSACLQVEAEAGPVESAEAAAAETPAPAPSASPPSASAASILPTSGWHHGGSGPSGVRAMVRAA